jgi:aryl-alcohol dehydrogenase-like predicted oxidoreductase
MTTTLDRGTHAGVVGARTKRLGTSDLSVFPLAISGNVFGWTADVAATEGILDTYRDGGGNFVDTADSYAGGRSEIMIGNWMRDRGNRDEIVVATKVGKGADHPGLTAGAMTRAVEDSLVRLRTDHIDLLYFHIDDPDVSFDETLLAADGLVRSGKIRYFGCADHTANRLIEARVASGQLGVANVVALQNRYNLLERTQYESSLARVAESQGLAVMPRFALASGFLSGKYRSKADLVGSERRDKIAPHLGRRGLRIIAALEEIAMSVNASIPAIALAWLLTKPNVVAPVVSASNARQVLQLMTATKVHLSRHDVAELDRVSA